jgi:hypothetical protein
MFRPLCQTDPAVSGFIYKALAYLGQPKSKQTVPELLAIALEVGGTNIRAMELLYNGHETAFGAPVPTKVLTSPVAGKCLLVSGHDLHDLVRGGGGALGGAFGSWWLRVLPSLQLEVPRTVQDVLPRLCPPPRASSCRRPS